MKTIPKGIIVSIQGYSKDTTQEIAEEMKSAGAVALRVDKPVNIDLPIIGLNKVKVRDPFKQAYITPNIDRIKRVLEWSDFVAVDYRVINPNLKEISEICKKENIFIIADIQGHKDLINIVKNDLYFSYISTTFSIFKKDRKPDIGIIKDLYKKYPGKVIAEGGYKDTHLVRMAYHNGAHAVCIGEAITGFYKLAKKFSKIDPGAGLR